MNNHATKDFGLKLEIESVSPYAANFRPPTWPPVQDYAIVINSEGLVVSRYGDSIWNLSPWAQITLQINFGDGPLRKGTASITKSNADILRLIAAWWLYGPRAVRSPTTLLARVRVLKPLFIACSRAGIKVTELTRYPRVLSEISEKGLVSGPAAYSLHVLYEWRDSVGLEILPPRDIAKTVKPKTDVGVVQTAYIPPRIWKYQVSRLKEYLDDFMKHKTQIENLYNFYLNIHTNGDLGNQTPKEGKLVTIRSYEGIKPDTPRTFHMKHFHEYAAEYGVQDVLTKWIGKLTGGGRGVMCLTSYLTLAGHVGIAYIINFSMMRINEAWMLRQSCLSCEEDEEFGKIYILTGSTSKTLQDDNARWITSSSVELAIEVLSAISTLRMNTLCSLSPNSIPASIVEDPWLVLPAVEPWSNKQYSGNLTIRHTYPSYTSCINDFPRLFDSDVVAITSEDVELSLRVSTYFPENRFAVGKPWPFAWHQLRRTGVVNMMSSSLVSDASIQYQLKHSSRAMSLYYGRGYSQANLNESLRSEYISATYEVMAKEMKSLISTSFISAFGESHKINLLKDISEQTEPQIQKALKNGLISLRPTIFGNCTKTGNCPYGGFENVIRCGGGDGQPPCSEGIIDIRKKKAVERMRSLTLNRYTSAPADSPLRVSLGMQILALDNISDLINGATNEC
ncbi:MULTISPECIES: site-specific integrase [Pseudomonas]|uniref:hypothetical protein n=1 Tax=Pseudomonas TaxID=286 RepID=UPI0018E80102|nr:MULTISPECIES: hypothetical protein [Pseudomonas]MBJ2204875.1 hypothetical protein [Pseudomonas carnis]MCR4540553.1 hypothetical protein [Pseudomonas sp. 18.1.10]MDH0800066.1 hypothetical protein [Pseudomonas carnis]MDY7536147.1 hypothetical protein [Pseudomonas sp. Bout1]MEB0183351.1 hypothetical protein [Pseudomonas sp. Bout1]